MKKWVVTLEITVKAENRDEAFDVAESKIAPDTLYMLYDAEEVEDVEKKFQPKFLPPVGTPEERLSEKIWPGMWFDALPFMFKHPNGSYHTGADLNLNFPARNADKGRPVYSISDGVVTHAGKLSGTWGNVVVVKHSPLLFSRYAHLETVEVAVGERVDGWTKLGTIGTMPNVQYSEYLHHLHFDISVTDVLEKNPAHWPGAHRKEVMKHYVDPKQFLLDRQG